MKSTPFREELDLAPIPFGREHRLAAKGLKEKGLPWRPQVGCFVWDETRVIEVPSPFLDRIYFVLNLGHFLKRFGTVEDMAEKLIWLPTWHQARLICKEMGMADMEVWEALCSAKFATVGSELLVMYDLILKRLEE